MKAAIVTILLFMLMMFFVELIPVNLSQFVKTLIAAVVTGLVVGYIAKTPYKGLVTPVRMEGSGPVAWI